MNPVVRVLLHLVFPSACPLCPLDRPSDSRDPICPRCLSSFPWDPLCEPGDSRALSVVYSAGEFDGPIRDLLIRLKYGGRGDLAGWLARRGEEAMLLPEAGFDCVVPIPASGWVEIRRGYNQAHLIGRQISRQLHLPLVTDWLKSRMFRRSQTRLDKRGRQQNAFRGFRLKKRSKFPYARVLLVDDVKTTGATLARCATLLRRAGAQHVSAFVIARDPLQY